MFFSVCRMELGEDPRVEVAAKIMQEICYDYRDSLMADIILCGWDKYKGGQVCIIYFARFCLR